MPVRRSATRGASVPQPTVRVPQRRRALKIGRGVDHVPIIEVVLRRDYGTVPDGATILDIGASTGVFSVYAAVESPHIRLVAFEPMPRARSRC